MKVAFKLWLVALGVSVLTVLLIWGGIKIIWWSIDKFSSNQEYTFQISPRTSPKVRDTPEEIIVGYINRERLKRNKIPVETSPRLIRVATDKACDLLIRGYWSHISPDGEKFTDQLREARIGYGKAGEILARDFGLDLQGAVIAWVNSPDHLRVIEVDEYRYIGVGFCEQFIVAIFVDKL